VDWPTSTPHTVNPKGVSESDERGQPNQGGIEMKQMKCDLCDDDTHVGFVDDACTFKVCKYCDTDGSLFAPKNWPVEVLNEIGLDRDGYPLPDHDEARMLDETHTDIREVLR
jgi:hypothetical protein